MEIPLDIISRVKEEKPLIHCITNPISINQCANAILALGALPIMAEHPKEVREITKRAGALLLNMGNITDARIKSFKRSLKTAKKQKIPVVLDVVGASCSRLRLKLAKKLLKLGGITVLKGNYSEINILRHPDSKSGGVDASPHLKTEHLISVCVELSQKYNCTILASGKEDIVCGNGKIALVSNGTPALQQITGTGCLQGAIVATYASRGQGFDAAILGALTMGICGELAEGEGNYLANLMDSIGRICPENIKNKMEVTELEKF